MARNRSQVRHAWIAGVEWGQVAAPTLQLLYPNQTGFNNRHVPVVDACNLPSMDVEASCFRWCRSEHRPFYCDDLSRAETLYEPTELIRRLVPGLPKSSTHAVYRLPGEASIFVPAMALIQALFMGTRILDQHLLIPNAPHVLGFASRSEGRIELHLDRPLSAPIASGRLVRLLAWLLLEQDGRIAHASVLECLHEGRIALRLPRLSIGGWARGLLVDDEHLLAYELAHVDIRYPGLVGDIRVSVGHSQLTVPPYEPPPASPWRRGYRGPEFSDPLVEAIRPPAK